MCSCLLPCCPPALFFPSSYLTVFVNLVLSSGLSTRGSLKYQTTTPHIWLKQQSDFPPTLMRTVRSNFIQLFVLCAVQDHLTQKRPQPAQEHSLRVYSSCKLMPMLKPLNQNTFARFVYYCLDV